MALRALDPTTRRAQLVSAARTVFAERGAEKVAVSDIVAAAGVAQGTFYLYFRAKNDVINAVAEEMVEEMADTVERAVAASDADAVTKVLRLRDALLVMADDPAGRQLAAVYHRPENSAVHERMAERMAGRLVPLVERIVRQGMSEGVFSVEDPHVAAWFILGGIRIMETACSNMAELAQGIAKATDCALRALGYASHGE